MTTETNAEKQVEDEMKKMNGWKSMHVIERSREAWWSQ